MPDPARRRGAANRPCPRHAETACRWRAKARAFVIYLRTRADTAAQRAGPEGTRPLLMGGESPVERMRQLIKEREPAYAQAHEKIDTDKRTAAQVAADVIRLAQTKAGW